MKFELVFPPNIVNLCLFFIEIVSQIIFNQQTRFAVQFLLLRLVTMPDLVTLMFGKLRDYFYDNWVYLEFQIMFNKEMDLFSIPLLHPAHFQSGLQSTRD